MAQAKLMAKASKKNLKSSTIGEYTPKKRAKLLTASVAVVQDDFDVVEESINTLDVDENLNDDNMNDVDIDVERRDVFFGGVIAPEGYVYIGKLAFICFGPTLKYFVGTLAMGCQSN
jgi:hypothetical protein